MQPKELREFIKRLRNSYSLRQVVDDEILDFLFEKCGKIPPFAVPWIEERFQVLYEKFPSKLHSAIMTCWWDYLREHPEQRAPEQQKKDCPYCTDGMMLLAKYEPMHERMTEYSANCGHCRQRAYEKNVPMMTRDQAIKRGFTVLDEDGNEYARPGEPSMWNAVASDAAGGREPSDERRADLR